MPPLLTYDTPGLRFDAGHKYDSEAPAPGPSPYDPQPKPKGRTMNKFKLELRKKTVADKLTLGTNHINSMTGNTYYPDASRVPTDAQVQTAQDDLAAADAEVDAAETIWKQKIQIRDAKESAWDTVITARANFCEAVTPNDLAALTSTGFPLRSAPTPIGDLPAPGNLVAVAGANEGEIDLSCDVVDGASSYEWECRLHTDGESWMAVKSSTTRSITATGLTPGALYAFRVRALGAAGPSPWSDEAVKRAP